MQDWHLIPIDELTEDQRQVYAKHSLTTEITDNEGEKVVIVNALEWQLLLQGMARIRQKLEEFLGA